MLPCTYLEHPKLPGTILLLAALFPRNRVVKPMPEYVYFSASTESLQTWQNNCN